MAKVCETKLRIYYIIACEQRYTCKKELAIAFLWKKLSYSYFELYVILS